MEVTRIFDLIEFVKQNFTNDVCLAGKKSGKWVKYSIDQYKEFVDFVSAGLLSLGIGKGNNIASISNNRPEWNFVDLGIMQIGAAHVPIYPTISDSEFVYIMNEAEVKLIFVSSNVLYNKITRLKSHLPFLQNIFCFDNVPNAAGFQDLLEAGKTNFEKEKLEKIKNEIKPNDLATIIYTSGTTAKPKGVMLSHANLVSNFIEASKTLNLNSSSTTLSYLPLCHVYERMLNYKYQYLGIPVYYAETLGGIVGNMNEVQPDVLTSVPLLLEKIYNNILIKGSELSGFKKKIFQWALDLTAVYRLDQKNGTWYNLKKFIADKLVYSKWRAALGGKLNLIICGGAALQPRLLKAFWTAGIRVLEGYGLTETSPLISNNHYNYYKLGTVGKILNGVEVKIADDGEVLCKSKGLMLGYYKQAELTAQVIDKEGWFHTGDIGIIEDKIFLKITGRKKDIFKTSSGIYVSPENIENQLRQSLFINHVFVTGANQNFLSAIIVPDFEFVEQWLKNSHVSLTKREDIIHYFQLESEILNVIRVYNQQKWDSGQIGKFKLVADDWSIDTGELTPKQSLKRNVISNKYADIIEGFYS